MKQNLVGTRLGKMLLIIRNLAELRSIPFKNPEQAAMIANGIMAENLITQLCPPNGVFLDIGAHIGSVFSSVHEHDPSISIYAVEADQAKAAQLSTRYPYCTLFECAVGEEEGEAEFYINPDATGYNSLIKSDVPGVVVQTVQIKRLDDLLPKVIVDVVKIDIEGAELGALRGATALIEGSRPTIMFESTSLGTNSIGYSAGELWKWLNSAGFGIYTPDRVAHNARPLGLDAFLDAHQYPIRTHNYFAVHSSRRIEVRDKARHIFNI